MEKKVKEPILKAGDRLFKMVEAYVKASNTEAEIIGMLRKGQEKNISEFKEIGNNVLGCLVDYIKSTSYLAHSAGFPKELFVEDK